MSAKSSSYANPRLDHTANATCCDATTGIVRPDGKKILFMGSMYLGFAIAITQHLQWDAVLLFIISSGVTLLGGHSLGMHRLFIHRAYRCPRWLANTLLWLGTLVGLGGPLTMLRTHDLRDWAQRQYKCHDYFAHRRSITDDFIWQIFCRIELAAEPLNKLETDYANWRFVHWLEHTAFVQQVLLACALFALGGLPWVLWGVCARVATGVTGHWLIGYFAHNTPTGRRTSRTDKGAGLLRVQGACTQGFNVPWVSLLCFGENWHNNHHAYPGSAQLGVNPGEWDPGWWILLALQRLGLVDNLITPDQLPARPELIELHHWIPASAHAEPAAA